MIYAEVKHGKYGLEEQYSIRRKVFIEEQGVDETVEHDDYDFISNHVLVFVDSIAVGTGRIINKDNDWLIGRIAVLKEYRGNNYGELIVRKLVDFGFKQGCNRIDVHAQLPVVSFYKKIGFEAYGKTYLESGIEHQSMYILEDMFYKCCSH